MLIILTLVLAGVSIFIALQLGGDGTTDVPVADECLATQPGGLNGKIVFTGDCTGQTFPAKQFIRPMTSSSDDCFVNETNATESSSFDVSAGTFEANPSQCNCMQFDVVAPNGNFGIKGGNWSDSCNEPATVTTYNCNTTNYTCTAVQNSSGKYSARADCLTACKAPEVITYNCNTDTYTCVAVLDDTGTYETGAECLEACVDTGAPVCGDQCTTDTDCPTDHFCGTEGTCEITGCTDTTCVNNNCTPICGGPCGTGIDACPTGHSCDPTTDRCVLDACTENGVECSANNCTIIPVSAIYGDERDYLIYGLMLAVLGLFAAKTGLISRTALAIQGINFGSSQKETSLFDKKREENSKKLRKSRNKYEDRF